MTNTALSTDILDGADKIADFIYGDAKKRRKVYHLAETKAFPFFRLGATLCARKSAILAWIAEQETATRTA